MKTVQQRIQKRDRRHKKIRSQIKGTAERPRLSVYRSNTALTVQLIDDRAQKTIVGTSSKVLGVGGNIEGAKAVGKEIAKQAKAKKIEKVVFDRGGFIYTGKIKALADSARENGLIF